MYRDANGAAIGSPAIYRDHAQLNAKHTWVPFRWSGKLWVVAGTIGAYGWSQQNPENHAVDRSMADMDAARYNAQLGRTLGASVSTRF